MGDGAAPVGYKQQLRFALCGLATRDLEQPSVAAARATLRGLRNNDKQLRAALFDVLAGEWPLHALMQHSSLKPWACFACLMDSQAHTWRLWLCALWCAGTDAAPKHAARCRLQLAEYAVLECLNHQLLIQVLSKLSQQVGLAGGVIM